MPPRKSSHGSQLCTKVCQIYEAGKQPQPANRETLLHQKQRADHSAMRHADLCSMPQSSLRTQQSRCHCLLFAYRLVSETNTKTKEDTADVKHGQVLGTGIDGSTNSEPESSDYHAPFPANTSIQDMGNEPRNSTCSQEYECQLQKLVAYHLAGTDCVVLAKP